MLNLHSRKDTPSNNIFKVVFDNDLTETLKQRLYTGNNNIKGLIIYMKKLLDSDWLRAVQFKCNTSAKSVTPVQITPPNSDYD